MNVVYYSQTDLTSVVSLSQVCADPDVDIIILAFVTNLVSAGGYPALNMASNCWAASAAQQAAGATGLLDCVGDGFASEITQCQALGKKVMLSLGGSTGDLTMNSAAQATQVANRLWNLFLGGVDPSLTALRPYGSVVLDGIDIGVDIPHLSSNSAVLIDHLDSELASASTYLPTLASNLRNLMSSDTSKAYYLSAAPQCPRPDASIPVPQLLPYVDFFSVQFYNNPSCQLDAGDGFFTSLQHWSSDLMAINGSGSGSPTSSCIKRSTRPSFMNINNGITSPRLLIGTPAFARAGSGYVDVPTYQGILQQVKSMGLGNLAGAMFWDGAYQEESGTLVGGRNLTFADVVRSVL